MNLELQLSALQVAIEFAVDAQARAAQREIEGLACEALDRIHAMYRWHARSIGQRRRRWKEKQWHPSTK